MLPDFFNEGIDWVLIVRDKFVLLDDWFNLFDIL